MPEDVIMNLDKAINDIKQKTIDDNQKKIIGSSYKKYNIPNLNIDKRRFNQLPEFLKDLGDPEIFQDNGIFPEIERSWKIFDNKLYIWNHNDLFFFFFS